MADFDPTSVNTNAAMLALINSSRSAGGKQGWADGMINKGAQSVTSAHGGGGLKLVGPFSGSGRGMFGGAGDKFSGTIASIGDAFLKSLQGPTGIQVPQIQDAHIGDVSPGLGRPSSGSGPIEIG